MLATGKGKAVAVGPSSAVTYVGGTSRNNTSSTSAVGDRPSGIQTGDLLVVYIAETGAYLKNVPSGWTYSPLTSVTQGARPWTAYKYASSSEPSTYTFEMDTATVTTVVIVAYRGGVVDTWGTGANGVDTVNAAGVSAIASGGILLAAYTSQTGQGKTFSTPTGMSPVISNNSNSALVAVFSQVISASGLTGTRSSTATGASISWGGCFYIRPGTTVGQQLFEQFATMYWTVPKNVTSISMVAVGGGGGGGGTGFLTSSRAGGGGGALSYSNAVSVTPGEVLTVVVGVYGFGGASGSDGTAGADSSVSRGAEMLLLAKGGSGGGVYDGFGGAAETGVGSVKYSGGDSYGSVDIGNGGGGAAGYAGNGGAGGIQGSESKAGTGGAGGGGGYGDATTRGGGGGGGVGVFGQGTNGTAGTNNTGGGGGGGSGGSAGLTAVTDAGRAGGAYGGGGGSANDDGAAGANGAGGAVRIIWGSGRAFPSTNTSNQ